MGLQDMERDKERLIERFMRLQDFVDQYNNEIYKVCCQIEALNIMIKEERARRDKTHAGAANGKNGGDAQVMPPPPVPPHPERQAS